MVWFPSSLLRFRILENLGNLLNAWSHGDRELKYMGKVPIQMSIIIGTGTTTMVMHGQQLDQWRGLRTWNFPGLDFATAGVYFNAAMATIADNSKYHHVIAFLEVEGAI